MGLWLYIFTQFPKYKDKCFLWLWSLKMYCIYMKGVEVLPRYHTAVCAVVVACECCLQSPWLFLVNVSPPGKNRCPKSDRSCTTQVYNIKEQWLLKSGEETTVPVSVCSNSHSYTSSLSQREEMWASAPLLYLSQDCCSPWFSPVIWKEVHHYLLTQSSGLAPPWFSSSFSAQNGIPRACCQEADLSCVPACP